VNQDEQLQDEVTPELRPRPTYGRARIAYRLTRFALMSARRGHGDFVANATRAFGDLVSFTIADAVHHQTTVACNLCGWSGLRFYPNTGPGYDERDCMCPGCLSSDRYRSLFEVLHRRTSAFDAGQRIVEVAPLRSLEEVFLAHRELNYASFDIERHAMETGDITAMRYAKNSVDWFICFHVLEHIPDEVAALNEIHRVLRPGGSAVFQVPIDWEAPATREYGAPDPRDVYHVRRHGADFEKRIAGHGFAMEKINLADCVSPARISKARLSTEPIFLARAIK
jgi:SAM-dependent methyltransferase